MKNEIKYFELAVLTGDEQNETKGEMEFDLLIGDPEDPNEILNR